MRVHLSIGARAFEPSIPTKRRLTTLALAVSLVFFFFAVDGVSLGQQNDSYDADPMFVSSVDADSSVPFSTVGAARRSRPPRPAKTREDPWYPEGFLTLSSPTPDPDAAPRRERSILDGGAAGKKVEPPVRVLDSSVEATPYSRPQQLEAPPRKKDNALFLSISIALLGLGIFLYYDFVYRNQLKEDLVRNAKLCSSKAVASDFDELLAEAPELTDPREPSYAEPNFDPDLLSFDGRAGARLPSRYDGDSFDVSDPVSTSESDLEGENFDFEPKGTDGLLASAEEVGDFVVGASST